MATVWWGFRFWGISAGTCLLRFFLPYPKTWPPKPLGIFEVIEIIDART